MASAGATSRARFGGFEFDLATRELRKGRTKLRVPDQSLIILAMMLEHPGELLTREAIQARLWPNGTIVEFEHSVNAAIKRLRQALSDTAEQPRYIETLPKRGYRFLAAVETVAPPEATPNYRIVEEIGRGAMGVVYRAEDLQLGRTVALKVLPPELASDPQRKARLIREARAASALNHPNIVTVHAIAAENGRDCIVMEYIAGKPLSDVIPRHGMPAKETVRIAIQIAGALEKAHAAGIIHRDLKPGNLMLTGDGQVKLLDFGLAKMTGPPEQDASQTQTSEGAIMGTTGYVSPEQAQGKPADARSDIFSFGSVLYEMVTGRRAFHGETHVDTLAAILHDDPLPPGSLVPGLAPGLEPVILKCLAKEPGLRFQNMGDVKAALEKMESAATAVAPPRRRRRALVLAPAAVMVLAAAATLFVWLRSEPAPADLHPVPLMSWPGRATLPTFSPDGNKVAFAWTSEKDDTFHIYVEQIGSSTRPVQLTNGPATDVFPAWSPDDRHIAFLREVGSRSALMLVPPLGGPERKIADLPGPAGFLAWTPDSRWVALSAKDSASDPFRVWLISVETGERREVTKPAPSAAAGDTSPCISPDGRVLAFSRELRSYVAAPYAIRLSQDFRPEGDPWELTSQRYAAIQGLACTADSRAIVYSGGNLSVNPLYRLPLYGSRAPSRLTYVPPGSVYPTISLSRSRLAYVSYRAQENLWRLDTRSGERKILVGSNWFQQLPQYSPDGRKIAFHSDRSGDGGIWTCDADGSNCQAVAALGSTAGGSPRWSPDSRWIAFDSRVEGRSQIYVIQADGGLQRRVTNGPADDYLPSWSQDGNWIYFASNRSGRVENWKIPAAGGTAVQVTRAGGGFTFESADGKDLYYSKEGANGLGQLFKMPAGGGTETQVVPKLVFFGGFCVTSRALYFTPDDKSIQRLELSSGRITTVASVDKLGVEGITVSPDETSVVWAQMDHFGAELMLVDGFR